MTVRSNIACTALSFSFSLFENPASNCELFVNESTVKWSEQRTILLTWSGSSLKIKFIHSFLTLESEGRQHKHCFSTTWHRTASCCLQSIFIIWFLRRHARWAGQTGSDDEAGVDLLLWRRCLSTLLHHRVVHSKSCSFGSLPLTL